MFLTRLPTEAILTHDIQEQDKAENCDPQNIQSGKNSTCKQILNGKST